MEHCKWDAFLAGLTRPFPRLTSPAATLAIWAIVLLQACKQPEKSPVLEIPPVPAPSLDVVHFDTSKLEIASGESFQSIVSKLPIDKEETQVLLKQIQKSLPPRIFAGQPYQVVFRNERNDTVLESFRLVDRKESRSYRLKRKPTRIPNDVGPSEGFQVDSIPFSLDTVAISGELRTHLYEAFTSMGESPALLHQVVQIFSWDLDFFRDPRKGDSFSLLVEKRRDEEGQFQGYGEILYAKYVNGKRDHYGILYAGAYYDCEGKSLEKMLLKAPLRFSKITVSSGFNLSRLHPILKVRRPHWGIDYVAPKGTPIIAAGNGRIEYAKWVGGYGKTIKIRHNATYNTYYAHLSGYRRGISAGKQVKQGDIIGYLGSTGLSTAPHLDYRIEKNGRYVNPAHLVTESKEGLKSNELVEFFGYRDSLLFRMEGESSDGIANKLGSTLLPSETIQSTISQSKTIQSEMESRGI